MVKACLFNGCMSILKFVSFQIMNCVGTGLKEILPNRNGCPTTVPCRYKLSATSNLATIYPNGTFGQVIRETGNLSHFLGTRRYFLYFYQPPSQEYIKLDQGHLPACFSSPRYHLLLLFSCMESSVCIYKNSQSKKIGLSTSCVNIFHSPKSQPMQILSHSISNHIN